MLYVTVKRLRSRAVDNIIFAVGSKTVKQFEDVENLADEVYVIGDAKEARSALEAIYEGARVAMRI